MLRNSATLQENRESVIRIKLLDQLKYNVQSILHGEDGVLHVSSGSAQGPIIGHTDNTNMLCSIFEAILIHGLKNRFGEKLASMFSSDIERMPVPNFWPVIMTISHKDLLQQVTKLTFITSDVGRGRSWMRLVLNHGQLMSYMSLLASDLQTLKDYYRPTAFLRDLEVCDIMNRVVQPLSCITFNIATNAAVLNTWTQTPLIIAGVWTPTRFDYLIDSVLPATDVASTLDITSPSPIVSDKNEVDNLTEAMFNVIIRGTPEIHLEEICQDLDPTVTTSSEVVQDLNVHTSSEVVSDLNVHTSMVEDDKIKAEVNIICDNISVQTSGEDHTSSSNVLMNRSLSTAIDDTEYNNLLSELQISHGIENLPTYLQFRPVHRTLSNSQQEPEEEKGFEILPSNLTMEDLMDSESLYPLLTVIVNEEGLLSQNYLCYREGCSTHVGLIYDSPRLCSFETRYYCSECHKADFSVIPARIIHNWDFTAYSVCTTCKVRLDAIAVLPIINLRLVNPKLYKHISQLVQVQLLRIQLYYIQAYLFTCKIDKGIKLRNYFWPREYIYEHINIYSVQDLVEVYNGKLLLKLQQNVSDGQKHILHCDRCSPRGFICEICKHMKVIYPFEIDTTFTCSNCCGVYHKPCIERTEDCPKCIRRRIQTELEENVITKT